MCWNGNLNFPSSLVSFEETLKFDEYYWKNNAENKKNQSDRPSIFLLFMQFYW